MPAESLRVERLLNRCEAIRANSHTLPSWHRECRDYLSTDDQTRLWQRIINGDRRFTSQPARSPAARYGAADPDREPLPPDKSTVQSEAVVFVCPSVASAISWPPGSVGLFSGLA